MLGGIQEEQQVLLAALGSMQDSEEVAFAPEFGTAVVLRKDSLSPYATAYVLCLDESQATIHR